MFDRQSCFIAVKRQDFIHRTEQFFRFFLADVVFWLFLPSLWGIWLRLGLLRFGWRGVGLAWRLVGYRSWCKALASSRRITMMNRSTFTPLQGLHTAVTCVISRDLRLHHGLAKISPTLFY